MKPVLDDYVKMMLSAYTSSGNLITLLQVLDMCAAPGSKTAQLIEYLHNTPDNQIPGMQHPVYRHCLKQTLIMVLNAEYLVLLFCL